MEYRTASKCMMSRSTAQHLQWLTGVRLQEIQLLTSCIKAYILVLDYALIDRVETILKYKPEWKQK